MANARHSPRRQRRHHKDFHTEFQERKLGQSDFGRVVNWMTSPDGAYFYYTTGGSDPKIMRCDLQTTDSRRSPN